MLEVKMTEEMLDQIIGGLETAIAFAEKRKEETFSGVDSFLLDSFIINNREAIAELSKAKPEQEIHYAPAYQPEG
jgi:hypothetical protein